MSTRRTRPNRDPRPKTRRHARPRVDALEARSLLATLWVTTAADTLDPSDDQLSLREAIEVANGVLPLTDLSAAEQALVQGPLQYPAPNHIGFALPAAGTRIDVTAPLPAITAPLAIDGYTQPGSAYNPTEEPDVDIADLQVRLDGFALAQADPGTLTHGLDIQSPNCTVSGLIITGFTGAGVSISGTASQGNWLYGNFIGILPNPATGRDFLAATIAGGTDPATLANGVAGVLIASSNNRLGGNNPGLRNVFANNGVGVSIQSPTGTGNLIQNNFILNNQGVGVLVQSSNNTIGEAFSGGGNLIGGNGAQGVLITGGPGVQGNLVVGNLIGTDEGIKGGKRVKGMDALPNLLDGILVLNSPKNTIGGYVTEARNVVGGNDGDGIVISGAASIGNRVLGNWVGFNISNGLLSLFIPNHNGVVIDSAGNFVGDDVAGAGNTIDNNRAHGLLLTGQGASGNTVQGNVIGLNPDGGSAFGNAFDGIHLVNAPGNLIGGTTAAARNVVSSNNNGIVVVGALATGNLIQGNFIGTGIGGQTDLGNAVDGVLIDSAPLNTVGGVATGAGNVISGNNRGVHITGTTALNNAVQGNFIGTDLAGALVINNEIDGVLIDAGASNSLIGGTTVGAGNTIAFNAGAGVNVASGTYNSIRGNSIHDNHGMGIVLNPDNNANNNLPAPVIVAAAPTENATGVQGTFDAVPLTTYTLDFFASSSKDPSGFGQGETYLFRFDVTTDIAGHFDFARNLPVPVPSGQFVTATASDAAGDTSAFSNALPAVPVQVQMAAATYTVNESDGTLLVSVTRTGGMGGDVAIDYATSNGTAVADIDYKAVTGTIFFHPGDPATKSFNIPILDPKKVGGQVVFNLTLSNPTNGATLGTPASATITIIDNALASFALAAPTYSVGENAGALTVTVTRNSLVGTSSVDYATADGTALAGTNYTNTHGTLSFPPGVASKTISIPILGDLAIHGPLTFTVTLSNPVGAIVEASAASSTVTVTDTDTPGAIGLPSSALVAAQGAPVAALTVQRSGGKAGTVTVAYATGGGTATASVDYAPTAGTLTFAPGETSKVLNVPLLNNTVPGTNVTFLVTLSSPGGGASLGTITTTTVTVQHPGSPIGPGPSEKVPPTIVSFVPAVGASGITGLSVTFSEAMDPSRAANLSNYAYSVTTPGRDRVIGTYDDGSVAVTGVSYTAATRTAFLTLQSPLALGSYSRIVLNRDASLVPARGLTDLAGNLLDGTGTGKAPGTPYVSTFGAGRRLVYTDHYGDSVTLSLSGPGMLALQRAANGDAQTLRFVAATPGMTSLTGSVRRPAGKRVTAPVVIPEIAGAAGVKIRLNSPFRVGSISATAVDRLAGASQLPAAQPLKAMLRR